MKVAADCRRVRKGGKLFKCRDYIGEDHACNVKVRKEGARNGEAVYDTSTTVMSDEDDANRRAIGSVE